MANQLAANGGYTPAGPVKAAPQPAGDPDYPAYRYHRDGRSKLVRAAREAAEQCPEGEWAKAPFPPPPPVFTGPVAPEKVKEIVDAATAVAVTAALDEQKVKFEEGKARFKQKYNELEAAFIGLQTRNDILKREHAELQERYDALEKANLKIDSAPPATEEESQNIFELAAAARAAGPEEKY